LEYIILLGKIFCRTCQSLGLPPVKKIFDRWTHSAQLNLCLFPDWFAEPQPDWPPQTRLTSFVYYDKQNEEIPDTVNDFLNAGSPPIIFTPGTAMKHADQFFRDCVEACQMLGQRGILLTQHPEQLPAILLRAFNTLGIYLLAKYFPTRQRLFIMEVLAPRHKR